ncbi:MAG: hypothetical protein P4L84_29255 [Isosphaeraceae bacterium]|nr:hypothetical protein [Isosphaeraceae bacterium]
MDDEECQRCGHRIEGALTVLAIEREGIPLDGSPLMICSSCVASYERWLRRHKKPRPAREEKPITEPVRRTHRSKTHRPFWKKHRRALIGVSFLLVALIGSALLMFVVIQNAERARFAATTGP